MDFCKRTNTSNLENQRIWPTPKLEDHQGCKDQPSKPSEAR